ncbi:MAG: hypothetical protein KIB45_05955 [Negativicoccus succinicivorans]|uniref:hypothetical protein n=1 Tax=Negativicoccus succinicivorans TaxID=620903 RepID=UPI0023525D47|nr:hypothetical protein [Negativicoccus succinicivorans]MBS5890607.1 hypothetical protein [Negativicoccus succinicivorans]
MKSEKICLQQGSDWRRTVNVKDGSGNPVNLLGAVAHCQIKQRYSDKTPVINVSCVIADEVNGTITIEIKGKDTERLWVNPHERRNRTLTYIYDVVLKFANGDQRVILRGEVEMTPLVTKGG